MFNTIYDLYQNGKKKHCFNISNHYEQIIVAWEHYTRMALTILKEDNFTANEHMKMEI